MYVSAMNVSNPILAFFYPEEWSKGKVSETEYV
jgi:hypothetical protein